MYPPALSKVLYRLYLPQLYLHHHFIMALIPPQKLRRFQQFKHMMKTLTLASWQLGRALYTVIMHVVNHTTTHDHRTTSYSYYHVHHSMDTLGTIKDHIQLLTILGTIVSDVRRWSCDIVRLQNQHIPHHGFCDPTNVEFYVLLDQGVIYLGYIAQS